jgi:hypothetical protein
VLQNVGQEHGRIHPSVEQRGGFLQLRLPCFEKIVKICNTSHACRLVPKAHIPMLIFEPGQRTIYIQGHRISCMTYDNILHNTRSVLKVIQFT